MSQDHTVFAPFATSSGGRWCDAASALTVSEQSFAVKQSVNRRSEQRRHLHPRASARFGAEIRRGIARSSGSRARARGIRLFDQLEDSSSFFDSVEVSSSPHRAFAFFRSTSSAAASASVFSLRIGSRSSSLTRFA